jgi:hypothetical protein
VTFKLLDTETHTHGNVHGGDVVVGGVVVGGGGALRYISFLKGIRKLQAASLLTFLRPERLAKISHTELKLSLLSAHYLYV